MNSVKGTLVALALGLYAGSAAAAVVNLTDITGTWGPAQLTDGTNPTGVNTSHIQWGRPVTAGDYSGYKFDGTGNGSNLVADQSFVFGTFTHENFPVYDASLDWAQLNLTFKLSVDGTAHDLTASFRFDHTETPNTGGNNCCNDLVEFVSSVNDFDTITIDGITYTFQLDGFVSQNGNPVTFFSTEEGKANTANLVGRFTQVVDPTDPSGPSPVPLPLPVALLGFGVAGLGVLGKLRRKG